MTMAPDASELGATTGRGPRPVAWLHSAWKHQSAAWFAPMDARALAICRVLVFWHVWPGFRVRDYAAYADFKSSAWYPVSFFDAWSIPLLDGSGLWAASLAASVFAFCALIGLLYPVSAGASALLTLYLHGVPQNFGKVNHSENLLMLALLVFAFARAADAWSVDALISRWRRRSPTSTAASALRSGHYRWPIRFVMLLIVTMYGAAGVSKLIKSGWEWAFSDSFRFLLLRHHFTHDPPTQLAVWLADYPVLCQAVALGALCLELAAPLALLGKWPRRLILPGLFSLQVGIWLLLGVRFSAMLPLFLCMLPWDAWLSRWDGLRGKLRWARV